ncbi:hypothetical protein CJ030_MR3G024374 [Morella rubra]|uniref:RNase H type-1 domain-containing protein n=1 Tax=Morella rubra TaxID=262757 RepID=A0A6A1W773_9ROSI|nr:hypothetical protein CJ030_MR3G024374 [Morella rubra]
MGFRVNYSLIIRNQVVHGGSPTVIPRLVARLQQTTLQHLVAWQFHHPRFSVSWVPPLPGSFKINVDVATHDAFSLAACICRDASGRIVHAEARRLLSVDPTVGEAAALWLGIQVAVNSSWDYVYLESDSLRVVDAVHRPSCDCPWMIDSVISQIQAQLVAKPHFSCSLIPS